MQTCLIFSRNKNEKTHFFSEKVLRDWFEVEVLTSFLSRRLPVICLILLLSYRRFKLILKNFFREKKNYKSETIYKKGPSKEIFYHHGSIIGCYLAPIHAKKSHQKINSA